LCHFFFFGYFETETDKVELKVLCESFPGHSKKLIPSPKQAALILGHFKDRCSFQVEYFMMLCAYQLGLNASESILMKRNWFKMEIKSHIAIPMFKKNEPVGKRLVSIT